MSFWTRKSFIALAIFIFALIPRVMPQNYTTYDEGRFWINRSQNFLNGLETGDLQQTAQAFHPGVGTMWMGSVGIILDRIISGTDHPQTDNMQYRVNIRLIMQIMNAASVAIGYLLLLRLIDPHVALLSAILWASEPFLIAHGSILHVDGLSTSMMMLSFLSGLIALYTSPKHPRRWWVASAVLGGFAGLTKITTFAVIGILFCAAWITKKRQLKFFFEWGFIGIATWFLFYPATWGNLDAVFSNFEWGLEITFSGHNNFFLGEPSSHPGVLYYLLSVLLRITPWLMGGLILSIFAIRHLKSLQEKQIVLSFFLYVVLFFAVMYLQSKQLDRYLLPLYPVLCVFAAYGLLNYFDWRIATSGVILAAAINFITIYPYPLAYYNPVLGGGYLADEFIMVGWGEGIDKVVDYIEQTEDAPCDLTIIAQYSHVLSIHLPCATVIPADQWEDAINTADYVMFYINELQREYDPVLEAQFSRQAPVYVARINHLEYAYLYAVDSTAP